MISPISNNCLWACPVCSHSASFTIPFVDNNTNEVVCRSHGYHWRLCRTCGSGYPSISPTLAEMQSYWNKNRADTPNSTVADEVWHRRLAASAVWAQRTYDFVLPHIQSEKRRFLDVACGLGDTVALFQETGWHAEGVDADPNSKVFHEKLGIYTTIGQIENVNTSSRFDFVSIAHAIYFISEPRSFVKRVRAMLDDDGLFLVVLSDFMSTLSKERPGYVHTWYPTSNALRYLLEKEGFTIVKYIRSNGSIMVLARCCEQVSHCYARPYRDYMAHMTHNFRYLLVGKPLLKANTILKRLKNYIGRKKKFSPPD